MRSALIPPRRRHPRHRRAHRTQRAPERIAERASAPRHRAVLRRAAPSEPRRFARSRQPSKPPLVNRMRTRPLRKPASTDRRRAVSAVHRTPVFMAHRTRASARRPIRDFAATRDFAPPPRAGSAVRRTRDSAARRRPPTTASARRPRGDARHGPRNPSAPLQRRLALMTPRDLFPNRRLAGRRRTCSTTFRKAAERSMRTTLPTTAHVHCAPSVPWMNADQPASRRRTRTASTDRMRTSISPAGRRRVRACRRSRAARAPMDRAADRAAPVRLQRALTATSCA